MTVITAPSLDRGQKVAVAKVSLQGLLVEDPARTATFIERTRQSLSRIACVSGVGVAVANHAPVERGLDLALAPPPQSRVTQIRAVELEIGHTGVSRCSVSPYAQGVSLATMMRWVVCRWR